METVDSRSGAACSCSECDWSWYALLFPSSPEAADSSSFDVQLGDIILTATDGLFDNMPDYMILQELKKLKVAFLSNSYIILPHKLCRFPRAEIKVSFSFCFFAPSRLLTMTASCRLHRVLQSKLTTWLMTPTICLLLHSLPVTMVWMYEVCIQHFRCSSVTFKTTLS